jgi:Leucine-rich repeat (LRR) protein
MRQEDMNVLEEALKRINVTKKEKLHYLDLKGLDLDVIPKEILTVPWIGALALSANKISDISILSEMKELHKLALTDNKISDISALRDLHKLRFIFLGDNLIEDITVLHAQTRLKKLVLNNNKIAQFPDLAAFKLLAYLDLTDNPLELPNKKVIKEMLPLLRILNF